MKVRDVLKYLTVVEKGKGNFSAYSPDVPGCVATGDSLEETLANMQEGLAFHLESLIEDGEPLPRPRGVQSYLDAVRRSEGEEYFLTHIDVNRVRPDLIPA